MNNLQILRPNQSNQWMNVLEQSFEYDFYHLPSYHTLAEERGEGLAHFFVYQEGEYHVAIPLLLRPIATIDGLNHIDQDWWDATCVYGYPGPVASHEFVPASVARNFGVALHKVLSDRNVITVFSRLHPLFSQTELLSHVGQCISIGQTVSVDIRLPIDIQRSKYRKNHKHGINKLIRLGVCCFEDIENHYLDNFIDMYYDTMNRVNAPEMYFFDRSYFEKLTSIMRSETYLFICKLDQEVICGGLFGLCNGIVQYHLGGTKSAFFELSPSKILFDTVRLWANERDAHVFHLGGGIGSQENSLFHFKRGFSDQIHTFSIWRWTLSQEVYDYLCKEKTNWNEHNNLEVTSYEYFPMYRAPTIAISHLDSIIHAIYFLITITQILDVIVQMN